MTTSELYLSVFDALEDDPVEALSLTIRADLMIQIERIIKRNGWSPKEAAGHCGVDVERITALQQGHIDKFTLDDLVSMAAHLRQWIRVELSDRDQMG